MFTLLIFALLIEVDLLYLDILIDDWQAYTVRSHCLQCFNGEVDSYQQETIIRKLLCVSHSFPKKPTRNVQLSVSFYMFHLNAILEEINSFRLLNNICNYIYRLCNTPLIVAIITNIQDEHPCLNQETSPCDHGVYINTVLSFKLKYILPLSRETRFLRF